MSVGSRAAELRVGRVAILALLLAGFMVTTSLGPAAASESQPAPAARKMLIVSLPTLRWSDLDLAKIPNMRRLLEGSALASLSVRSVSHRPNLGDAYTTISAGTRSVGRADAGECLGPREPLEADTASSAFRRRTGTDPPKRAAALCLAHARIVAANRDKLFGAEPGVLGDALASAGIPAGVVANGDGAVPIGPGLAYRRAAALALVTGDGVLKRGSVSPDLIKVDHRASFGLAIDERAYLQAFRDIWSHDRAVALVENSDLVRLSDYSANLVASRRRVLLLHLLETFDKVLGRMLLDVDLTSDAVLVIAPTQPGVQQLTMAALHAPGLPPSFLESATTRRSGVVSIVDIGPTILDQLGIARPESMEGRPFEEGDSRPGLNASIRRFATENRRAVFRDTIIGTVTLLYVLAVLALLALAIAGYRFRRRRLVDIAETSALVVLIFPIATYLAGVLPFYRWGALAYWLFVVGTSAAVGLTCQRLARGRGSLPLVVALAIIVAFFVGDTIIGAHLQYNTVFGYSPTVAGRFAGIGNPAYSQLATASLMLAALIAHRVGSRRGTWAAIALLALVVVVDGMPLWGADVGGVLSMVPAFGVVAIILVGWRIRPRLALYATLAAVAAVAAFAAIDLARPSEQRTHLGRLIESTRDGGVSSFWLVVHRKLDENIATFHSGWSVMLPAIIVGLIVLIVVAPRTWRKALEESRAMRAAVVGLLIVGTLGFTLNDSGLAVPGFMLAVIAPVIVIVVARLPADLPEALP